MKRVTVLLCVIFGLVSCLPEGQDPVTTAGIADYWVLETGDITETLDLYIEKGKAQFTWTRQIAGKDIVTPVKGRYNTRHTYDYGEKWYMLTLIPEDNGQGTLAFTYKMTLSQDKRVMALEGNGVSYYYRVEKEKNSDKKDNKKK